MLHNPTKRICPSLICMARSNTERHFGGLTNGSKPSTTSINAKAPSSRSARPGPVTTAYFFAADALAPEPPLPRMAWKNSLFGSTTIRSDLLRKLAR